LLGAGTSYNKVDGKRHYPLMWDLLEYVRNHSDVKSIYEEMKSSALYPEILKKLICNIFEKYLYEDGESYYCEYCNENFKEGLLP